MEAPFDRGLDLRGAFLWTRPSICSNGLDSTASSVDGFIIEPMICVPSSVDGFIGLPLDVANLFV